jgi:hypothetical protein
MTDDADHSDQVEDKGGPETGKIMYPYCHEQKKQAKRKPVANVYVEKFHAKTI